MKTYTLSDFIKEYVLDPTGKLIKGRHHLNFGLHEPLMEKNYTRN